MGAPTEVKIVSDSNESLKVAGYLVVYGGRDIVGDSFGPDTDFWLDKVGQNPMVLYQHGQDPVLKRAVVGRVTTTRQDDIGLWVEAQISASKQYSDAIRQLVKEGLLGWSSGSVPHLVQRVKGTQPGTMKITSWPIVEASLTPTPAEPRTIGVRELKSLAALEPALSVVLNADSDSEVEDARMDIKAQQGMPSRDYAWVDSDGTGHLDISDEGHVRAAMARFNQTHFDGPDSKRSAARKIIARARSMGIDVSPDSAVASAAKGVNMNDLPDDAFGYIEPGTLDDEKKTFPRANRHFLHHDENGDVDGALLVLAIAEAEADTKNGNFALSHLLAHRDGHADAHSKFWDHKSASGQLLVIADDIMRVIETVIADQKSMDHLDYGVAAERIRPEPLNRLDEIKSRLEAVLAHARQAEEGDDGTARAEYIRRQLALLEV